MKAMNNTLINSIMTKSVRYICMFLLLLGTSASAWGAKTGTIYFGNNGININTLTVNGADNQSNTWKIVTAFPSASTSFTQSSDYSQVGASSTPASTITFGVKLSHVVSISAFSAKFGGFTNTAGTVTLKVTNKSTSTTSNVGSGSLSGTSDVTVSNSTTASGDSLTVTVTGIAKGVKCYYISYTYSNVSAYTVTYDAEGGTCATEEDTEGSADAGVELPSATLSSATAAMGWGFYGWATSAESDITTTAPTIVGKAGDTYYPEANITLHAVYAKGEYTKVTSTSEITVGSGEKYLIMGYDDDDTDDGYGMYAMTHESFIDGYGNEYMYGYRLGDAPSDTYSAAAVRAEWRYEITKSTSYYYFQNITTSKYVDTELAANRIYATSLTGSHKYIITFSTNGYCTIKNNATTYDYPYLNVFDGDGSFSNGSSGWEKMMIYKETTSPMYCSAPKTVKVVASPAAGGIVDFDIASKDEVDFTDEFEDFAEAVAEEGYEFLRWETGNATNAKFYNEETDLYDLTSTTDDEPGVYATGSAVLTAYFYKQCAVTYTLTGLTKLTGVTTVTAAINATGFSATFSVNAHYRTSPLTCSVTMGGSTLTEGSGNDYTWDASSKTLTFPAATDITGDLVITISAEHMGYTKYAFSCSELTLTPHLVTASTPIFITSTASTTVRSQDYIEISGNGLTPSTELTFPGLPAKFAIKNADGTAISTNGSGEVSANAYIFYTPGAGDTGDGLDELSGITVCVSGAKPKQVNLTQSIIGRHLPADFVIAGKKDNKWYALPADFSDESTPAPVEIAVDDINNPSIAYTASTNIYNLYGQNSGASGFLYNDGDDDGNPDGEKIKLGMKNNSNKPLFAFASPKNSLKGDGTATVTNNINKQYWWTLKQVNTTINISNAQDAKYIINSSNNSGTLSIKNSPFAWGTYASGVEELRLIPASEGGVVFAGASVVAWGKNSAIIEADAGAVFAYSVIGKLPDDIESSKITLTQTGTSVKGTGTRYNYTVNFGEGVDFSANEGKMLTLEWYDILDNLKAISNVMVPRIVATNTTINSANYSTKSVWATEVHVLPGNTLFIDASGYTPNKNVTINELHIYPNATVQVLKDTLIAKNLILRNGWNRLTAETEYDVARLYIQSGSGNGTLKATNAYLDWYIDYDQYYPIAVPWNVATSSISYRNTSGAASAGLTIRHYDGERHAKGGKDGDGNTNWQQYTWGDDMPENLVPGIGYAITARRPAGKAFSIVRMPLTIPSTAWTTLGEQGEVSSVHKDQVSVTAWVRDEGETPDHAKGWNFIANPYMSIYEGAITHSEGEDYDIEYVNIPDVNFKEFEQVATETAKLKPGGGVLIQTKETGTLTFGTANRKASAPSYLTETPKVSKQKAYILLSGNEAVDQMGLIISDNYTAEYEVNADLEKLLSDGNTLRTYMIYNNLNMAYVAINEVLAQEWIPVSVRIPASGEYSFSLHNASKVGELEGIYLIDYANGGIVTNLIEENYTFVAEAGTIEGRFAINAKVGQHKVPTDIDIVNGGGDLKSDAPFKFLYDDKAYIYHRGVIYDATGKRVREINR